MVILVVARLDGTGGSVCEDYWLLACLSLLLDGPVCLLIGRDLIDNGKLAWINWPYDEKGSTVIQLSVRAE